MRIIELDRVDSTQAYAQRLLAEGIREKTVIWAHQQDSGRGQYERSFHSPVGGLYFTLIDRPELNEQDIPMFTLAVGAACSGFLEQITGKKIFLKWPNDLYLEGGKVGGILCQHYPGPQGKPGTVLCGIGLNVNSTRADFPEKLWENVTTVRDCTGRVFSLRQVLFAIIDAIGISVFRLAQERDNLLAFLKDRDYLKGKQIVWQTGTNEIKGIGLGLHEDGRYRLRGNGGPCHLIAGGTIRLTDA